MKHPITPPPELIEEWRQDTLPCYRIGGVNDIVVQAARWGSDQELEACCEWLDNTDVDDSQEAAKHLRAARRPKPLSLKEQALHALLHIDQGQHNERYHIIRRALEQLDD